MSGTRLENTPIFPEKLFYTIGEISRLTKIQPHILRYWENHFKVLRPARRYSGHRKYTRREIDLINQIRHLVVDRKFTLDGARKEISKQKGGGKGAPPMAQSPSNGQASHEPKASPKFLEELKKDVEDCLAFLNG